VYIIASIAGSRVVLGASVAGVSVVDVSVVGASDAVEAESPPPQAETAIVAIRAKKTGERRDDM
jgi:tetrahydrodipicolinate N-succinyltransferase